jgi:hypothetical protein
MLSFRRPVTIALVALTALAGAGGAPALAQPASPPASAMPAPTADAANPPENPLITARVRQEFLAWQGGRINRSTYSPDAGGTYIDAYVSIVSPSLAIGGVQTVRYQTASLLLGDIVYRYEITGPSGAVSVLYSLDSRGKTDGIVFTPEIFREPATP